MKRHPKDLTNSISGSSLYSQKDSFLALLTPRLVNLEDCEGKATPSSRLRSAVGRERKPVASVRFDRMNTETAKSMPKTMTSGSSNQRAMTETSTGYETLMTPRKQIILVKDKIVTSRDIIGKEEVEERLRQKVLENERMRVELYRMENEVRICQNNLKTAFNNKEDATFTTSQLSDKELKDILKTLNLYLKRSEETFEDLKKKCCKLDELINYMDSGHLAIFKGLEVKDISDYLKHMLQEFKTTSQLELELGIRSRELVKKKLDYAHLGSKHNKLSIRCEALQRDLDALKESLKAEHVEKNIFVKSLTKEKTLNRENQKKLGNLQQTLELLIETPHAKSEEEFALETHLKESFQMHQVENPTQFKPSTPVLPQPQKPEDNITKLRDALSKLVKENEGLRRIIHVKGKEFKKLSDNLSKTTWKLDKANIRIEKLRNLKGGHKMNDGTQDEEDLLVAYFKQKTQATKSTNNNFADNVNGLPKNLDFRFGFFEERYVDLVNDVLEGGSQAFAEHIRLLTSDEEIKQEITLISNQFISYRNFAEKLNRIMSECVHLFSLKSVNQVMIYVSNAMKQVMGAHTIRIWAHEHTTGTFRTMETPEKELRCLVNRGLISEVIRTSNRILRRNRDDKVVVLEYLHPDGTASEEKAHTCFLVPLKVSNGQIVGVLEISRFNYDAFLLDLEYFAQILVEMSRILFEKLNYERVITSDLKHKEMFFDVFAELANSISEREFAEKIEEWVPQIFQTSRAQYFQANASDLIRFPKGENPIYASGNLGIIGKVSANKKPFILLENAGNALYSENIDIKTTFPLYTVPVILKKRYLQVDEDEAVVVGVLQIIMNHKHVSKGIETEESVADYVKTLDPSFENLISKFTKLVAIAYDVMNSRKEPKK